MLFSISDIFIKRPVLTTVCTIVILLLGGIAIPLLPIASLPAIAPTQIQVTSNYTGADAKTTENTVTTIIERQIIGVEGMEYMSSNTNNNGNTNIAVSFPVSIDPDIAQVNVQNRVSQVQSQLPSSVQQTGVTVQQASPSLLLVFALFSERDANGKYIYDELFVSNYVDLFMIDEVARLNGVGDATIFGEREYAMRIWLDPDKLAARGLTASDVVAAVQEQNIQVGAGSIGQEPLPPGQQFEIALRAIGRFETEAEAEEIVVKVGSDGGLIKIKDVGRAELGAQDYSINTIFNGDPAVGIGIYQLAGSNALDTANLVKAKIEELSKTFPPGLKTELVFDTTEFVTASVEEVVKTLIEAIVLVILVIYVFLQDWKATLIPAIAIPVSLIGAMALLLVAGFEINQLTLFGCVLATGLVVDDGIVVVEAIMKKIEQGMKPLQASLDAMEELTGAVISTSLVLMAVFIPVAFFPGTTGIVYKQFALTIAFSIAISTFNALSFSPAMGAILLRPQPEQRGILGWFFGWFNRFFNWVIHIYGAILELLGHAKILVIALFIGGLVATGWLYQIVPTGFIPDEDQGYFILIGQAPAGVSLQYTQDQTNKIDKILSEIPEVQTRLALTGFGFNGNTSNQLIFFNNLTPWDERKEPNQSVYGVIQQINRRLATEIDGVRAFAINAPAVSGLSNFGGFEMQIENVKQLPMLSLIENANNVMAAANKRPELAGVFSQFPPSTPQMSISVDRNQAKALNLDINEIFNTLQTYLGSNYVNDFVLGQRQYRVYVQAEGTFRNNPEDIGRLYVRTTNGDMVQLNSVVEVEKFVYPPIITRYNGYQSIDVVGGAAPGYSSGQALGAMQEVSAQELGPGFSFEWTGTALEELSAGGASVLLFGLGFVMVFLVLAAQYESYIDPTIIMLTVPLAILGALGGIWLRANLLQAGGVFPQVSNDVYTQVGLVMLIGMASKNTILIVEFANQSRDVGMSIVEAAIFASKERLRPILMTALSAVIGFMPLVTASGAGALSRWSLGTAVLSGLLVATILSLFFAPILYIVIKNFEEWFLKGGGGKSGGKPPQTKISDQESSSSDQATEQEIIPSFKTTTQND